MYITIYLREDTYQVSLCIVGRKRDTTSNIATVTSPLLQNTSSESLSLAPNLFPIDPTDNSSSKPKFFDESDAIGSRSHPQSRKAGKQVHPVEFYDFIHQNCIG